MTVKYSGYCVVFWIGVLNSELVKFLCRIISSWKRAFKAGSSIHGKARRASLGSNCVIAKLNLKLLYLISIVTFLNFDVSLGLTVEFRH